MIELINFLKTVPKKLYTIEIIILIAGYIKQNNYKRSDFKNIVKKLITDEELDNIFDSIDMTKIYELQNIKIELVKVKGEKLNVHDYYKYIEMKRYYEDLGLCKILFPSKYCILSDGEYNTIDIGIYFGNKNYTDGKKIYNFGKMWMKDPDMKTFDKLPVKEIEVQEIDIKMKKMRNKLNSVMGSDYFLDV